MPEPDIMPMIKTIRNLIRTLEIEQKVCEPPDGNSRRYDEISDELRRLTEELHEAEHEGRRQAHERRVDDEINGPAFEYKVINIATDSVSVKRGVAHDGLTKIIEEQLNTLGSEGWKLVSVNQWIGYLRRRK